MAGGLKPNVLRDDRKEIEKKISDRLDLVSAEYEKGWICSYSEKNELEICRTLRGVTQKYIIDNESLNQKEAGMLHKLRTEMLETFEGEVIYQKKEKDCKVSSPSNLLKLVLKEGEKGLTLQRYKGLGEMNADQLWETTLDPDSRSLLQVKIEQSAEEGTTFSDLMGDDVEPRRIFIQEQALNVSNLDF